MKAWALATLFIFVFSASANIKATPQNGEYIPDFQFKTLKGDLINKSTLKNRKYWIMEFWASWCGPCRIENQHMRKIFNKLGEEYPNFRTDFGVIGMSLDTDTNAWKRAIQNDWLEWDHQVCDTLKWNGPIAQNFGFVYMPYNFILDANGKIISQGIYGQTLEDKLRMIIKP